MENRDEFTKLADDIEAHPENYHGAPDVLKHIVDDLRNLEFDDFHNNLYPAPKMAMISAFELVGRNDIVIRIKNGDFDQ